MMRARSGMIALMAGYFFLYGCGGGGTSVNLDSQARADLPGTWRLVQAGGPGMPTVTCPGIVQIGTGPPTPCTANFTITINSDGTFRAFDGTTGTWAVNQNRLTASSGQTTINGSLEFHNQNAITVRENSGRFLLLERIG